MPLPMQGLGGCHLLVMQEMGYNHASKTLPCREWEVAIFTFMQAAGGGHPLTYAGDGGGPFLTL